jgi:hypothetical protein
LIKLTDEVLYSQPCSDDLETRQCEVEKQFDPQVLAEAMLRLTEEYDRQKDLVSYFAASFQSAFLTLFVSGDHRFGRIG